MIIINPIMANLVFLSLSAVYIFQKTTGKSLLRVLLIAPILLRGAGILFYLYIVKISNNVTKELVDIRFAIDSANYIALILLIVYARYTASKSGGELDESRFVNDRVCASNRND